MGAAISLVSPDIDFATATLGPPPAPVTSYAYDPTNTKSFGITATISQSFVSTSATLVPVLTYPSEVIIAGNGAIATLSGTATCSGITVSNSPAPLESASIKCPVAGTAILPGTPIISFQYLFPTTIIGVIDMLPTPSVGTFGYTNSFGFSIADLTTVDGGTTTVSTTITSTVLETTTVYPNCFQSGQPSNSASVRPSAVPSSFSTATVRPSQSDMRSSVTSAPVHDPSRVSSHPDPAPSSASSGDHHDGHPISASHPGNDGHPVSASHPGNDGHPVSASRPSNDNHPVSASHTGNDDHPVVTRPGNNGHPVSASRAPMGQPSGSAHGPSHDSDSYGHGSSSYEHGSDYDGYHYGKKCHAKRRAHVRRAGRDTDGDNYAPPDFTFGPGVPAFYTSTATVTSTETSTATSTLTATNSAITKCPGHSSVPHHSARASHSASASHHRK